TQDQTLILHWDGNTLLQFMSPSTGVLNGVTVVPGSDGNDAWAAGYYINTMTSHYATLLERWNGSAWSVVSSPNVQALDNRILGIYGLAATAVWAVGVTEGSAAPSQNLALHWNGTSWTISAVAQQGPYSNQLYAVTGTASDDVYAVGLYFTAGDEER